jgi:MFS family permease
MAASGVGSTIAALGVAFTRRIGPGPIVYGAIGLGVASVVLAASTSFAVSLVAMFFAGMGAIAMAVTANTTIQMTVPDHLRGRVMSVYTTLFAGSVPAGGLFAGAIASGWGVGVAFLAGAVLTLAVGVGGLVWLRRIRRSERRERRVTPEIAAGASGEVQLGIARRR